MQFVEHIHATEGINHFDFNAPIAIRLMAPLGQNLNSWPQLLERLLSVWDSLRFVWASPLEASGKSSWCISVLM